MENFQTLCPVYDGSVVTLWLARPDLHNAFNQQMIKEMTSFFSDLEDKPEIRIVVIRGQGKSFCSGADLHWMKNAFSLEESENLKECQELSSMFHAIFNSSKTVIAAVHGNVFGGGNGLVAACDLAYSLSDTRFCLSEAKIGVAAATITPYLLQKISPSNLKELIFTARSFNGEEAVKFRLVNQHFTTMESMNSQLEVIIGQMLGNGKNAMKLSKQLINKFAAPYTIEEMEQLPRLLAQIRVSNEALEGFSAFQEKRKPNW